MRIPQFLIKAAPTLTLSVCLVAAWLAWHHYSTHYLHPAESEPAEIQEAERTQVELSTEKIVAARIELAAVESSVEKLKVIVPGRLAYDPSQLVNIRCGADGILTKVLVKPGDSVEAGQVIALLSSPEVGTARADQLQRAAAMELAKRQLNWDKTRADGIKKLIEAIKGNKSPEDIRVSFNDQLLGEPREKLLAAYAEKLLATNLVAKANSVAESGALSTRTVEERVRGLDAKQAALQATMEQSRYDADRAAASSQIEFDDAQRRYDIAAKRVATLLGPTTSSNLAGSAANPPTAAVDLPSGLNATTANLTDLSIIEVRAPRSGTIEKRLFNENERVQAGDNLLEIADTSRLWLKADIRESHWAALNLKTGQAIEWTSPALPGESMTANIVMMGREVDPQTNAIALVASINNDYGKLRPGLFVRVELPMGETSAHLLIPESAVATHEGQTFVFVTNDDKTFMRRDVRVGQSTATASSDSDKIVGKKIEVIAGLNAGEKIATSGVFHLKSELLLEREE